MGAKQQRWWKRPVTWVVAAAVVVAGIGVALALSQANRPAAEGPVTPTPTVSPTFIPTEDEIPDDLAEELEPDEPTPTADLPYCEKFRAIIAGGTDTGSDDQTENLKQLAAKYKEYLAKYTEAAALAPDGLADDYRTVMDYLSEAISVVESGDMKAILAKFEELEALNTAMDAINDESRQYCS